jgi:hypothetical protein
MQFSFPVLWLMHLAYSDSQNHNFDNTFARDAWLFKLFAKKLVPRLKWGRKI